MNKITSEVGLGQTGFAKLDESLCPGPSSPNLFFV